MALTVLLAVLAASEVDTDRDGLSDFAEAHKYFTDPNKADTDGDAIPDGDWNERREFTYSVRAVVQVLPPVNLSTLDDDYQDARVLEVRDDAIELEVILYPFNTNAGAITEDPNWRTPDPSMQKWLQAGLTSNWDSALERQLTEQLGDAGIEVAALSDKQLVERVAPWLMKHAVSEEGFTTFDMEFVDGKPRVPPELTAVVANELKKRGRTREQQWDRELYGKQMFESSARGTCTSSAIYLSTCLRALGIPTRSVLFIPVIDSSDERQLKLVSQRISHLGVQETILRAAAPRGTWASHSFNEVFVGGRWQRLNYDRLGQNILDDAYLGLMIKVNSWADHSEAGLVSWGLRHARHDSWGDDVFGGPNPYRCVSLSDLFGAHSKLQNDPKTLTVSRAYWYDDPAKAAKVVTKQKLDPATGQMLIHLDELLPGSSHYRRFVEHAPPDLVLRAKGKPDVPARVVPRIWCDGEIRELALEIAPTAFATMARGARYELIAPPEKNGYRWRIAEGVGITRR